MQENELFSQRSAANSEKVAVTTQQPSADVQDIYLQVEKLADEADRSLKKCGNLQFNIVSTGFIVK